jgi:hypothetical protein
MVQNSALKASPKNLISTSYVVGHPPSPTARFVNPFETTNVNSDDDIIGATSSKSHIRTLTATQKDNPLHKIDNSCSRTSFPDITTESVDLRMLQDALRPVVDKIKHAQSHLIYGRRTRTYIPDLTIETVDFHMPQYIKDAFTLSLIKSSNH